MNTKSNLTMFARGVGVITVANILTKAANFFLLPLYTAHISPDQMGIYETIVSITSFVLPLLILALDSSFSAFYFDIDSDEYRQSVFSTISGTLFVSSSLLLVLIPVAPALSRMVFGTSHYSHIFAFALCGAAISMWHLPISLSLRMNNRLTLYAVISLAGALVSIGVNIYLILFRKMGINALVISGLIMNIFLFVLYYVFSGISYQRGRFDLALLKRMITYSLPLLPLLMIRWVLSSSDRFILLKYAGSSETGIYGIADKFPSILSLLTNGITISYSAFAFSSVKEKNSKSQFIAIQALTHVVLLSLTIIVASIAKEVVGLMADPAYISANRLLGPLLLGQVCHISSVLIAYAFAFVRKSYLNLIPTTVGAIINLILNLILIPLYGSYAAALTTMVGYACILLLTYWLAKRYFPCNYLIGRTTLTLALSIIAIVVMDGKSIGIRLLCSFGTLLAIIAIYHKPLLRLVKSGKL